MLDMYPTKSGFLLTKILS